MAGSARPPHLINAIEGKINLISSRIRVLEGVLNVNNNILPLFNGITTSTYSYGTALFSKIHNSNIEFTINNSSRIWAICDKIYSDSGGSSPKDMLIESYYNDTWNTLRINPTISNNTWYDLTGILPKGTYRISPTADYININELFVENLLITRTFIYNDGQYKYYDTSTSSWISIGTSEPTYQQYMDFGMNSLSPRLDRVNGVSPLDSLYGLKTFKTYTNEKDNFLLSIEGKIRNQLVYANSDISLVGVETIQSINLLANGNSKIAISVDKGVTWKAFRNGVWETIVNAHDGMTNAELNSLTSEQIESLRNKSNSIRFSYSLSDNSDVDNIKMTVMMMGYEILADTKNFSISYDQVSNKIIYNITKSGTYSVNYIT